MQRERKVSTNPFDDQPTHFFKPNAKTALASTNSASSYGALEQETPRPKPKMKPVRPESSTQWTKLEETIKTIESFDPISNQRLPSALPISTSQNRRRGETLKELNFRVEQ